MKAPEFGVRVARSRGPTDRQSAGTRLLVGNVQITFRTLRARAGVLPRSIACRPTLHSLRHSFAVNTLLDADRTDGDAAPTVAVLSTYLGHYVGDLVKQADCVAA